MRMISYCQAINEAIFSEMERDPAVFIYYVTAKYKSDGSTVKKHGNVTLVK